MYTFVLAHSFKSIYYICKRYIEYSEALWHSERDRERCTQNHRTAKRKIYTSMNCAKGKAKDIRKQTKKIL